MLATTIMAAAVKTLVHRKHPKCCAFIFHKYMVLFISFVMTSFRLQGKKGQTNV